MRIYVPEKINQKRFLNLTSWTNVPNKGNNQTG
jgi:hypothetical protein